MSMQKVPSGFYDFDALKIGNVTVGINAIVGDGFDPAIALSFRTTIAGLAVSFQGNIKEIRDFATTLCYFSDLAEDEHKSVALRMKDAVT